MTSGDFQKMLLENKLDWQADSIHQSGTDPACRRYFMFRNRLRLTTPKPARALNLGSFFHTLLQSLVLNDSLDLAEKAAVAEAEERLEAIRKFADKHGMLPGGLPVERVAADMDEDLQKARAMAEIYWTAHPLHLDEYDVPYVEQRMAFAVALGSPLDRPPVTISGKLDLVLRHKKTGEYWIVDHKTTSANPLELAASFPFSMQARLYRLLLIHELSRAELMPLTYDEKEKRLSELSGRVAGFIYNVMRKPTIKYCNKDADFPAYVTRCRKWYVDLAKLPDAGPAHLQASVRFMEPVLSTELLARLAGQAELATRPPDLAFFWRNERECRGRFGNSLCPYFKLCSTPCHVWPAIFKQHYLQAPQVDTVEEDEEIA